MAERMPSRLAASWSTSGSSSTDSTRSPRRRWSTLAGLRATELEARADDAVRSLTFCRGHRQCVALRQCDQDEASVDELAQPPRHEREQRPELDLGR